MSRPEWDQYFLIITRAVALRADCCRAMHGAVIVKDRRIVSTGYNASAPGGPSCIKGDCPRAFSNTPHLNGDYSDCINLHAAQNAMAYANRDDTQGATIYVTGPPCIMCHKLITAAGIIRVVYPEQT